jgi:hypothetical protein
VVRHVFGGQLAHQRSMGRMKYLELLDQYRTALSLWSEVRSLYSSDKPEVRAATSHLEALEQQIGYYPRLALAA